MSNPRVIAAVASTISAAKLASPLTREGEWNTSAYKNFDAFIAALDKASAGDVLKLMEDRSAPHAYLLYPSGWWDFVTDFAKGSNTAYPGALAKALVGGKDEESLTDLLNVYYSRSNRRTLTPEALKIFTDTCVKKAAAGAKFLADNFIDDGMMPNGIWEALKKPDGKAIVKKIFMALPQAEIDKLAWDGDESTEWASVFDKAGIKYDGA